MKGLMRFRAPKSFNERLAKIIAARGYGIPAELQRDALARFLDEEEKRLGIVPPKTET